MTAEYHPRTADEIIRQHADRVKRSPVPEGTWRCAHERSHGPCNTLNDLDDESCGACGESRPEAPDAAR